MDTQPTNSLFHRLLSSSADEKPGLPLAHITSTKVFGEILLSNRIDIGRDPCPVFGERLNYFFYGKPVYRLRSDETLSSKISGNAAVCLLFKLEVSPAPRRIHALDTGAVASGRLSTHLTDGLVVSDFHMPPVKNSPGQLVSAFYGSNEYYYDGKPKANVSISPMDHISQAC